jgi:hypothetical protein
MQNARALVALLPGDFTMMKKTLSVAFAALAFTALTPADVLANPQHERMKRCNAEAKTQALKGDERKAFMSGCLKGAHTPAAEPAQGGNPMVPAAAPNAAATVAPVAVVAGAEAGTAATQAGASDDDDKARTKACNQSATEQALKGAKRKAFVSECMKG